MTNKHICLTRCTIRIIVGISVWIWPFLAHSQATIVSEREPIVVFDEADLNPAEPAYEWEGASLLQNIRVIDGTGVEPVDGRDLLVANGKIAAVGPTGPLDVPSDAKIIDGD